MRRSLLIQINTNQLYRPKTNQAIYQLPDNAVTCLYHIHLVNDILLARFCWRYEAWRCAAELVVFDQNGFIVKMSRGKIWLKGLLFGISVVDSYIEEMAAWINVLFCYWFESSPLPNSIAFRFTIFGYTHITSTVNLIVTFTF